jgi:hypothetical protein
LESHELGGTVATITKKRHGNEWNANFEINVGDGRYILLNDPKGLQALNSSMKVTAASQLIVLQDQLGSLMAQLTKQILFCMPRGLAGSNRCINKISELQLLSRGVTWYVGIIS